VPFLAPAWSAPLEPDRIIWVDSSAITEKEIFDKIVVLLRFFGPKFFPEPLAYITAVIGELETQ
jgi:hypothetical protein